MKPLKDVYVAPATGSHYARVRDLLKLCDLADENDVDDYFLEEKKRVSVPLPSVLPKTMKR